MLTSLQRAMIGLLTDAGWSAWAEDCVPPEATFPYVTCRVSVPLTFDARGEVVLTAWAHGPEANLQRLTLARDLIRLFPQGGSLLALDECVAALFPSPGDNLDWPRSDGALGARFRLDVMAFPSHKGE